MNEHVKLTKEFQIKSASLKQNSYFNFWLDMRQNDFSVWDMNLEKLNKSRHKQEFSLVDQIFHHNNS
jgi:hypothetical protein